MAVFKCLTSGQTVEFVNQHDIDSMKGHSGYERIDEVEQVEIRELPLTGPMPARRAGRPRKTTQGI